MATEPSHPIRKNAKRAKRSDIVPGAGVFHPPSLEDEPEINLGPWRVLEVQTRSIATPSRHFVGLDRDNGGGRVSSPIIIWDAEKRAGITRSGRVYKLIGKRGSATDAEYVLNRWLIANVDEDGSVCDVTTEYVKSSAVSGRQTP